MSCGVGSLNIRAKASTSLVTKKFVGRFVELLAMHSLLYFPFFCTCLLFQTSSIFSHARLGFPPSIVVLYVYFEGFYNFSFLVLAFGIVPFSILAIWHLCIE